MIRQKSYVVLLVLFVAGCSANKPSVVSSPYKSGRSNSEPVFYNGKHYRLGFVYRAAQNLYDVNVIGRGNRKLGGTPGDQKVVSGMASSAMSHFACARGQKAAIVPGTSRHSNGKWHMQARCG